MKNFTKISALAVLLAAFVLIFSSWKKDPVELENSYMDFIVSEHGVWAGENDIRYVANLKPETLSGEDVTITYSSEADPEGFSVETGYYNTTLEYGRDMYNIQKIDRSFYAAASTDADGSCLKVNPEGDVITIDIGNGAFTETIDYEKPQEPLMVASITIGGNGYITGDVYYYNEEGDRPEISMYSESDQTAITTMPNSDLGDNGYRASDPSAGTDFGYTIYSVTLVYEPENAPGWDNEVNVNFESDTFYVSIEGNTFSVPVEGETIYKTIMTPVSN